MNDTLFDPSAFLGGDKDVQRIQRKYAAMFQPTERVLDLGCGNGVFLGLLRERSVHGIGIDSFPQCIEACRKKGLEAQQADLLKYVEGAHEEYDGIFCSHIIEHLAPETVLMLFAHSRRILRPGGRIIIVTPNTRDIDVITERFWLDISHVRPYPIPLLEKMLEHAGFSIERSGLDPDSGTRVLSKNPAKMLRKAIKKLRWGEYWGKGDSFVIGMVPR
jgi:cyclopropane fatty-acyl-phospholipid synthase-like methyltransferase